MQDVTTAIVRSCLAASPDSPNPISSSPDSTPKAYVFRSSRYSPQGTGNLPPSKRPALSKDHLFSHALGSVNLGASLFTKTIPGFIPFSSSTPSNVIPAPTIGKKVKQAHHHPIKRSKRCHHTSHCNPSAHRHASIDSPIVSSHPEILRSPIDPSMLRINPRKDLSLTEVFCGLSSSSNCPHLRKEHEGQREINSFNFPDARNIEGFIVPTKPALLKATQTPPPTPEPRTRSTDDIGGKHPKLKLPRSKSHRNRSLHMTNGLDYSDDSDDDKFTAPFRFPKPALSRQN